MQATPLRSRGWSLRETHRFISTNLGAVMVHPKAERQFQLSHPGKPGR